jgi:hypothetical protein
MMFLPRFIVRWFISTLPAPFPDQFPSLKLKQFEVDCPSQYQLLTARAWWQVELPVNLGHGWAAQQGKLSETAYVTKAASVGRKASPVHSGGPAKKGNLSSSRNIPKFEGTIGAGTRQRSTIRGERNTHHAFPVSAQRR